MQGCGLEGVNPSILQGSKGECGPNMRQQPQPATFDRMVRLVQHVMEATCLTGTLDTLFASALGSVSRKTQGPFEIWLDSPCSSSMRPALTNEGKGEPAGRICPCKGKTPKIVALFLFLEGWIIGAKGGLPCPPKLHTSLAYRRWLSHSSLGSRCRSG